MLLELTNNLTPAELHDYVVNLFAYFSLSASFFLIFPILLNYHSETIDVIDKITELFSGKLIESSKKIMLNTRKNESRIERILKDKKIESLVNEFLLAKEVIAAKNLVSFMFGVFSLILFFIMAYKIFHYSHEEFPIKKFLFDRDEMGFFWLCWAFSIGFSFCIFFLRVCPLYFLYKQNNFVIGKSREVLTFFGLILLVVFWQIRFFYFAYPAIAYFVSTILLMLLLLIENISFFMKLNGGPSKQSVLLLFKYFKEAISEYQNQPSKGGGCQCCTGCCSCSGLKCKSIIST